MKEKNRPVVIELDPTAAVSPAQVPPVGDSDAAGPGAGAALAVLASQRPSVLARAFWGVALALVGGMVAVGLWDFAAGLLQRNLWLGRVAMSGLAILLVTGLGLAFREWVAFARLKRVDRLRQRAVAVGETGDLDAARGLMAEVSHLYHGRRDMEWALENLRAHGPDILDAEGLIGQIESDLMTGLDRAARREVEVAARQVATITAIVPLALADVLTALVANMRMIRRIAEIYGGRAGVFGSWRLLRTVMVHLVATGAVSVGDDMIQAVLGGGLVGKLSRRFGEGVVNGALTARVGVAAMDVCRPLPFVALPRPGVTALVKGALRGVFGAAKP